jgi:excisionase family DNA binding protein
VADSAEYNELVPRLLTNERITPNMAKSKTNESQRKALSVFEVAAELGVSEQLVRLEIQREMLKASRFGRRVIIQRADLDRYLAERTVA